MRGVPGNSEPPRSLWDVCATGDPLCHCEGRAVCLSGASVMWVSLHPLSSWAPQNVTTGAPLLMGVFLCRSEGLVGVGVLMFVGPYPVTELP